MTCTCGGEDACPACDRDPLDGAETAPEQVLVAGAGAKYPPAPAWMWELDRGPGWQRRQEPT